MEEQQETQEVVEQPTTSPLIEATNATIERQEAANKKHEELLLRQERLEADRMLSGKSEAGAQPVEPKEETPQEYNARINKEISEGKHNE